MTNIIKNNFPPNYDIYVEGFGGGASVLLSCPPNNKIEVYNDLGENVYSLFKVLSNNEMFMNLKRRLELTPYSEQLRCEFKELLKTNLSLEDRAYYFIYVNRTSFNGVGGFSTTMVVRRNMSKSTSDYLSMIERLPELHERLSSVIIEHKDIMHLIDKYNKPNVFMYLDPPYVQSSRKSTTKYEIEMTDIEHEKLCEKLLTFKGKLLISGYETNIYNILTENGFHKVSFVSPNSGSNAIETLWKNY